jgi:hypothetical protein
MNHEHWRDGGAKSRKLWFSAFAVGVLFAGMMYAANHATTGSLYGDFVGGVVGVAGMYLVGNVGAKWVAGSAAAKLAAPATEETPAKKP